MLAAKQSRGSLQKATRHPHPSLCLHALPPQRLSKSQVIHYNHCQTRQPTLRDSPSTAASMCWQQLCAASCSPDDYPFLMMELTEYHAPAGRQVEESPFMSEENMSYTLCPDLHRPGGSSPKHLSLGTVPENAASPPDETVPANMLQPEALRLPKVKTPRCSDEGAPTTEPPAAKEAIADNAPATQVGLWIHVMSN